MPGCPRDFYGYVDFFQFFFLLYFSLHVLYFDVIWTPTLNRVGLQHSGYRTNVNFLNIYMYLTFHFILVYVFES